MIRRKIALVFCSIFLVTGTYVGSTIMPTEVQAAQPYSSLNQSISQLLKDERMKGVKSSITIRQASSGEIVYQSNADEKITPASTLKILTSAAALETLGEEFRFQTDVLTDGTVSNGVLTGNLYLRGTGDPTLLKKDFTTFAIQLKKQGIQRVTGNLVGDDTWFDTVRLSPSIIKSDESYYYAAQISALTLSPNADYDAGSVIVHATPTSKGKKTKIAMTPETSIVSIVNNSKTVPKGSKNTLKIVRKHGTNTIIITGNAPISSGGRKEWIAVSNPTAYALDVFKTSLKENGILFSPTSKTTRVKTPAKAEVLVTKDSMTLKELIKPFMKLSNNTHAEILAKTMGKEKYNQGTWNAGLKVMREFAGSIGLRSDQWLFEDASGMSHSNKVSSSQLTELLFLARNYDWYSTFLQGLPIAGSRERLVGGTLKNRLKTSATKGKVLAKTGSLDNVSSLAGYIETKQGETLIFSVLTQNHKKSTVPVIDKITVAIATAKK